MLDTGEFLVGRSKSRAGVRTVAIPEVTIPVLRDYLDPFVAPGANVLIFAGSRGGILRRSNFRCAAKGDESTRGSAFRVCPVISGMWGNTIAASSDV
ncbi:hypothetical protein ACIBO5_14385 [Nonomuraea angiospora]|uniref:hypothetical protein n=1 Tax=Nonomuraea angiospora TaxID=46172 RepID=UPI0029A1E020|nr:hypothetical protein [Nonomuraea angiospora]MDX3105196.1 hypothetical protein [Nonomuraea angiospora]